MKHIITEYFGHGSDLDITQMCFRATLVFFVALIIIKVSGMRSFSNRSAFDIIISIMLGAILSRAVVGANPFIPTCIAGLTIGAIHRVLAILSVQNDYLGRLIKGAAVPLYENEIYHHRNMMKTGISKKDILEEVHEKLNVETLGEVKKIYMERSGKISIIKK